MKQSGPPIVRVEQLYPLPVDELRAVFESLSPDVKIVWVQEEPENMGAWRYLRVHWDKIFPDLPLTCVSRPASASPATGSKTAHEREQQQLIERALAATESRAEIRESSTTVAAGS